MTIHTIASAILWAALMFTAICSVIGAIAFLIGGFLVYVAERELREHRRKSRKDHPR